MMTVEEIMALVDEYAFMYCHGEENMSDNARSALTAALGPVMAVVDAAVAYEAARSVLDTDLDDDTVEAGAMFGVLLENYASGRDGLIAATEAYLASRAPAAAPAPSEVQDA